MILESLRLAIDLLCLAAGLAGILLTLLVYMRTPSHLIADHALTLGVWTINQALLVAFFYVNAILHLVNPGVNAAMNDATYFTSGVFAALLIRLLHAYFRRTPGMTMTVLMALCALTAPIPVSLLMRMYPQWGTVFDVVEAIKLASFYAALIAVAVYLWRAAENIVSDELRRMLRLLAIIQAVFYPVMLWEGSGFFHGSFFVPVSSFSLFYGIINILWLYFVSRHVEFPVVQFVNSDKSMERFVALFDISDREKEIVALLLNGHSYKAIAAKLFIAHETVKSHVTNIYRKAGVKSKMELAKAVRNS